MFRSIYSNSIHEYSRDIRQERNCKLGKGWRCRPGRPFLPPLLVRHMTPSDYAIWVLVLQVGAYFAYFDFGLQTAIGRYVAFANEKNDFERGNSIFSTAFAALFAACVLSVLLLFCVLVAVRQIFPGIPASSVSAMRWSMLILGTSLALGLPASAWNGVFIGLQRNEIPAIIIGAARMVSAIGVVAAAFAGKSVIVMAAAMATTYLVSYGVQYLAMRRIVPKSRFDFALVRRSTASELSSYCFGLTVMSFSMLLVTGFDLILVGRFQFNALTPYSVAASLMTFVSGVLYAILNVTMPHATALHARQDPAALGQLVIDLHSDRCASARVYGNTSAGLCRTDFENLDWPAVRPDWRANSGDPTVGQHGPSHRSALRDRSHFRRPATHGQSQSAYGGR